MIDRGNVLKGATVFIPFNAHSTDSSSIDLSTNGTPKVYANGDTTPITAGVTLVENHNGITGRHGVSIDTSNAAYLPGTEYFVALDGAVVDTKTQNVWLGCFSLMRRQAGELLVGTLTGGSTTTATLPAGASATDDEYVGAFLTPVAGAGAGQMSREITDYNGTTKVATFEPALGVGLNNTTVFVLSQNAPQVTSVLPNVNVSTITTDAVSAGAVSAAAANKVADAALDRAIDTSFSLRKVVRLVLAVFGGKSSGFPTTGPYRFRNPADTKDVVSATGDGTGNRSAVTLDLD